MGLAPKGEGDEESDASDGKEEGADNKDNVVPIEDDEDCMFEKE